MILEARLRATDLNYYGFLRVLFAQHNVTSLGADLTILGLNAAGAVVAGSAAKAALAAASAGIVGAKTEIDTDLFYQKTLPALVVQMDAQRKSVLVNILRGLSQSPENYDLQQGLSDVDSYYVAGTIPGAISGIITDAGGKSQKADAEIDSLPMVVAVSKDFQVKKETVAACVKSLSSEQHNQLAKDLGQSSAPNAEVAILYMIGPATTPAQLDLVTTRMKTLFPDESCVKRLDAAP
jgi:hypothetical protein